MKKITHALLPTLLCLALFCVFAGKASITPRSTAADLTSSGEVSPSANLPGDAAMYLYLSSGVGAWYTELVLSPDGSFTGFYRDMDMGTTGEGYPNGTMYVNRFSGSFENIRQLDEHSYALTLSHLTSDYEEGKSWIEDGIRYVSSVPYGMEQGGEFLFYLPDTPVNGLSEEFLSWWPSRYTEPAPETLELSALLNVDMGYGFFG